jgi:hypothetical protein
MAKPHCRSRGDVYPAAARLLELLLSLYPDYCAPDRPARRTCLLCSAEFQSRGPGHRRCPACAAYVHAHPDYFAEVETISYREVAASLQATAGQD